VRPVADQQKGRSNDQFGQWDDPGQWVQQHAWEQPIVGEAAGKPALIAQLTESGDQKRTAERKPKR